MARVFGLLFSGFVVRIVAAGFAIYVAITVAHYVAHVFATVNNALPM